MAQARARIGTTNYETQVVTGRAAGAGVSAQRLGHTHGWNWATAGASTLEQVLGHTQGLNWARGAFCVAAGVRLRIIRSWIIWVSVSP